MNIEQRVFFVDLHGDKFIELPYAAVLSIVHRGWDEMLRNGFNQMFENGWNGRISRIKIKESDGKLSLSITESNNEIDKIINEMEEESIKKCCCCGSKAHNISKNWFWPYCDIHHLKKS